ncbi:MAG: hypothetical protein J1G06_08620 [Oscillospiraceae bacterium]|nr:hypothetical protein [Oscillospiraceae bacterium]
MTRAELLQIAKPILFNAEMVQAILDGRKMVTRRAVKHDTEAVLSSAKYRFDFSDAEIIKIRCQEPYKPGDILYVRETWQEASMMSFGEEKTHDYIYKADYDYQSLNSCDDSGEEMLTDFPWCVKWRPSIHMPKEAARIFLRVKSVRVERLQEITTDEAIKEGIDLEDLKPLGTITHANYVQEFATIWNKTINRENTDLYGWDANPWVWVIEFERVEVTE